MQSFLPRFAIVDTAKDHDNKRAREVCADIQAGEVVVFDKAYVDFDHLFELTVGEVSWVTRAKDNFSYEVLEEWTKPKGHIIKDELVVLATEQSWELHPEPLRRVTARVEVDGKEVEMTFLTDNLEWSAATIADLYRSRWSIEVFFKQIKQTLQLSDFLGHSANAVRWQIWTALLTYLLLRYLAFLSDWSHSFTRLFTVLRSVLWRKIDLLELLRSYGTAGGSFRMMATPQSAYFPGF
jgi:IS4 transposase